LLGTLPIQFPVLTNIPFSSERLFISQSRKCINELWDILVDQELSPKVYLGLYETNSEIDWIMHDYHSHFDFNPCTSENIHEWLSKSRIELQKKNEHIGLELDLPIEWASWIQHSGLLPKWDTIDAINTFKEFELNTQDGPLVQKPVYVGLDSHQEFDLLSDMVSNLSLENHQSSVTLQKGLQQFFESCCTITTFDIKENSTQHAGTDNIFQKMLINPEHIQNYVDVLSACTHSQGPDYKTRLLRKVSRDNVISNQVLNYILKNLDGRVNFIIIDRDIYPYLSNSLWNNGWIQ
jgi:hypothetical protein